MAECIGMQRLGAGFAQFWARLRRAAPRKTAQDTTVTPDGSRDHLAPGESAMAWITTHSELGEMAGVAIEMLDLSRRRHQRRD